MAIIFAISSFLLLPSFVFAQIEITEIVYDAPGADTGREWVEVTNTGVKAIDIGKFKLFENGTNHGLKLVQGTSTLEPNASAVIASDAQQFLVEHPSYSGALFDSAFSLSNTGESIAIKDAEGIVVTTKSYVAEKAPKSPPAAKKSSTKKSTETASSTASRVENAAAANVAPGDFMPTLPSYSLWLLGLVGVILLGIGGVLFLNSKQEETSLTADEFKIE